MGAELTFFNFKSKAYKVEDDAMGFIENDACENGCDTYSGGIGQKSDVTILSKVFSSADEMEEYCEENGLGDKWSPSVYVAEISDVKPVSITKTKSLIALEKSYEETKARLDSFESDILAKVKLQSSLTKSCKNCGHRHEISSMTSLRCGKCRTIMLTATQLGEKKRLQEKAKSLKLKIDKSYAIAERKGKSSNSNESELTKRFLSAKKAYEEFDSEILKQVKHSKSKTKSCKGCGTRYEISSLRLHNRYSEWDGSLGEAKDFICPQCSKSMLSPTQEKQKYSLAKKLSNAEKKLSSESVERTYGLFSWCAS